MLKLPFIYFFNFIFLPLYGCFFAICFLVTFVPIFPVITAKQNIKERLNYTGLKNRLFVVLVLFNYIFYLFEIIFFDLFRLSYFSLPKDLNLEGLLKELKETYPEGKDKGFTYLLGHCANLEFYCMPVVKANKNLNLGDIAPLAKRSRYEIINKILVWYRTRPGVSILWTDKDLFQNMRSAIDKGCSICLLVDQKPRKNGVFLKFFDEHAIFPTSGLRYCMNSNSIVIYIFSYRIIPGWVKFSIQGGKNQHLSKNSAFSTHQTQSCYSYKNTEKILPAEIYNKDLDDKKNENVHVELAYFTKWLQENIKKYPTQWCWDYRKWSRKP